MTPVGVTSQATALRGDRVRPARSHLGDNGLGQPGNGTNVNGSVPEGIVPAAPVVTDVSFGGVGGTGLTQTGTTWTATTPGGCGRSIHRHLHIRPHPNTITTPGGFTYGPAAVTTGRSE